MNAGARTLILKLDRAEEGLRPPQNGHEPLRWLFAHGAALLAVAFVVALTVGASPAVLGAFAVLAVTVLVSNTIKPSSRPRVAVVGTGRFRERVVSDAEVRGWSVVAAASPDGDFAAVSPPESLDEIVIECAALDALDDEARALCNRAPQLRVVDPATLGDRDPLAPVLSSAARLSKRAIDVVMASIALVVMLPVSLIVAIKIRIDSPGPVFFTQTRVGIDGRRFRVYKFRTMFVDNDDSIHRAYVASLIEGRAEKCSDMFKLVDDPRVTAVGRMLRRYSIDEFPQFLNVLKGDMSLVGPRPPLPREVALYGGREWQRLRVRPGLTGAWQIAGRSLLDFHEMVELDVEYWQQWGLARELAIVARTPRAVLSGRGAT